MALEELIVAWGQERPAWQREVMRRTAAGHLFSDKDYDKLVDNIVAPDSGRAVAFGLEHLPKAAIDDPPVRLISIAKTQHVNALASDYPLTFEPDGLTIVYGDNGSGKSGYARLLKRITRARHQEEVHSDVFRDTATDKPMANLLVRIGDRDETLTWPEPTRPELQRVHFYDGACREAYIATESDFPFRPSALVVMDGLISACVEVRRRIDTKLYENVRSVAGLPVVGVEARSTEAAKFLEQLSGRTRFAAVDEMIARLDTSSATIDELRGKEILLRKSDTTKERKTETRQAEKMDSLCSHVEKLHSVLSDTSLADLQESRDKLINLQEAANLLARSFESEPLTGVGSSPWKKLWESARRFSEANVYPNEVFPVLREGSRCVLCQQPLSSQSRDRLARFESFVKDDIQTRLDGARQSYDSQVATLSNLVISPDAVESNQRDLESTHGKLIKNVRVLLYRYGRAREQAHYALMGKERLELPAIEPTVVLTQLKEEAKGARALAEGLGDPKLVFRL